MKPVRPPAPPAPPTARPVSAWASAPRYPVPGTLLLGGKYRVEALIGEGGMGSVVRAIHSELDEPVAIKIMLPQFVENADIVRRFMREAKSAAKLKNEHVARVIDVGLLDGELAGRPYIVMEHLEGADLRAIIKHHGPQPPSVAADLLLQACEAIAEAHSHGIIHRDIKPANFFITHPDAVTPHLKVVDFGIATAPQGADDVTSTHTIVGTPSYMAPEQMRHAREANPRSDVWSLGVVLYETIEGRRPFPSDIYSELVLTVGMDPPQPMTRAPEAIRAIVFRCLEKALDRRYQTVAELALDLVPFASNTVQARASAETSRRLLERRKSNVIGAPGERADPISGTPAPLTPMSRMPLPGEMPSGTHPAPGTAQHRPQTRWGVIIASFAVACAIGGGAWWYLTQRETTSATSTIERPATKVEPKVAPKIEPPTIIEEPRGEPKVDEPTIAEPAVGATSETVADKPADSRPATPMKPKAAKPKPVVRKPPDDPFSRR